MNPYSPPANHQPATTQNVTASHLQVGADNDTADGAGPLIALSVVVFTGYILHCIIWPFRACRRCHGTGRAIAPGGRAWRTCPACKGTPARLRAGHRIWTHLKNTNRRDR